MDQFADWDKFHRHFTLTQDPQKSLRWLRYEKWVEKRRLRRVQDEADLLATESAARAGHGPVSRKST